MNVTQNFPGVVTEILPKQSLCFFGHDVVNAAVSSHFFFAISELALKRWLSLLVSRMWQRWVRRLSRAVVMCASPNTAAHSLKLRLG